MKINASAIILSRLKPISGSGRLLLVLALSLGRAGAAPWSGMGSAAEQEVRGDILPFWLRCARNPANQGLYGQFDDGLHPQPGASRGELRSARVLWAFSRAYREYHDPQYLEMARYAFNDLTTNFVDEFHGGFFWTIAGSGQPLDEQKLVLGQALAIDAFAEYYRAAHPRLALRHATALFHLLDERAHDPDNGGYFDSFDRSWRRRPKNLLGPAPKTANSTLQVLEAFTDLLRVWPDPLLEARERELVRVLLDRVVDPRTHHLVLYLSSDWQPLSDRVSCGRDIELSWLLTEAADAVGDPGLQTRARRTAVELAEAALVQGFGADVPRLAGPAGDIDANREGWNQAEAIAGFLNAYQITHEDKFAAAAQKVWHFLESDGGGDHRGSAWFRPLRPGGSPLSGDAQISLWQGPEPGCRACFQIIEHCRELDAAPN